MEIKVWKVEINDLFGNALKVVKKRFQITKVLLSMFARYKSASEFKNAIEVFAG